MRDDYTSSVKGSESSGALLGSLLVPNSAQTCNYSPIYPGTTNSALNSDYNRKRARFLLRAFMGVETGMRKGFRFRWFVLTESDEALSAGGLDFSKQFHRFITWLRKQHCPDFQYIAVEHRQGDKRRRNWHILSYGSDKIPVHAVRHYWQEHFKSTVTGMEEVKDIRKAVKYLAGYLSSEDKFIRSWHSQGWVFKGWISASQWAKKNYGEYPSKASIVDVAVMSDADRASVLDVVSSDRRQRQGVKADKARLTALRALTPGRSRSIQSRPGGVEDSHPYQEVIDKCLGGWLLSVNDEMSDEG